MQSVSSRFRTRIAVFISYGDNDYTTRTLIQRFPSPRLVATKSKDPSLSYYLLTAEKRREGFLTLQKGFVGNETFMIWTLFFKFISYDDKR